MGWVAGILVTGLLVWAWVVFIHGVWTIRPDRNKIYNGYLMDG